MKNLRSTCPINYSLEILGDTWSLLILRDIIYFGKQTYGEFLASDENIARNILADRLLRLQQQGIIQKTPHPTDRRKDIYRMSEAGLDVIPILLDLAEWGSIYGLAPAPQEWRDLVRDRRNEIIALTRMVVSQGGSIFAGEHSVAQRLQ